MPRYIVERTFPNGLDIPADALGADAMRRVVDHNMEERVTWMTSFLALDRTKTFCVYDAPSPEAIRRAAQRNGLPVDRISEVRTLDPYFQY